MMSRLPFGRALHLPLLRMPWYVALLLHIPPPTATISFMTVFEGSDAFAPCYRIPMLLRVPPPAGQAGVPSRLLAFAEARHGNPGPNRCGDDSHGP